MFVRFIRAAASPKRAPRRAGAQNLRKWRSDLVYAFVVFCLFSAFVVKGLWLFVWRCFGGPLGAPRVSWGLLWGPLARGQGAQKGPPYRRDSLF